MSWARSFYLRERSSLYRHRRIVSSRSCSEWSFWSFSSKVSKVSIMLAMLTVITSDSSDQSDHFETLITQWLSNHCCLRNHARESSNTQDNHWKSLIKKKSNVDRFCKQSINIIIKDSNIKICCFESKQLISISQIWIKQDLQNETKELKLNCYINNHLEEIHESEISE